ncbi:hypothetical protein [Flavobacterium defluvii]|uniref:Lipoprotein n=1 Tax=Flavobacterium defluvii TaxID=370979 RepID=A0A1M5FRR2_9FLAO|nr:hypothetical protein [Flavobacterium defluvii]SHF93851.1 hypothetical protein SAMN05443663_101568 [Flavobacterium defluvii]
MKKIFFIFLFTTLYSCLEGTSTFTSPKVTFSSKYIIIENRSNYNLYNVEIKFANKYNLAYASQQKKSKIKFKYNDIIPSSAYRELIKNKYEMNYQDYEGNNYQVIRKKIIYQDIEKIDNISFLDKLNTVLSSSSGITILLALLAAFVALQQVKSNVISSSRIKWIEEFKNDVSEYTTAVRQLIHNYGLHIKYRDENEDPKIKNYDEYIKYHYKASIHESNLRMNLNLDEQKYKEIKTTLNKITECIDNVNPKLDIDKHYKETALLLNQLRHQSQMALKTEWKKSQKMFYFNWFYNK